MNVRRALLLLALAACVAAAPAAGSSPRVITLKVGEVFVASGQTGSAPGSSVRAVGRVVVRARWNLGAWYVVTTTRTDARGNYRFTIRPRRRGTLELRVTPPDRRAQRFILHVR
jgi:hypothetical protein